MQQLELFPEIEVNPQTIIFTFKGVEYVTSPAEMEIFCEDDEPRATCNGCAFFDEDQPRADSGCSQSEKVYNCVEHNIIWVKKG